MFAMAPAAVSAIACTIRALVCTTTLLIGAANAEMAIAGIIVMVGNFL